jgi:hypothetical protein
MPILPEHFSERNDELLHAALAYAGADWRIFPCLNKHQPLTKHGYKDATNDPVQIARWWRRWPRALIGTATGHGFVVLDVDVRDDRNGFSTLRDLGVDKLPNTPSVKTPSGGHHLYFEQTDPPIGISAGAGGRGIGRGLDWRGVGGYVILPPSAGYEWIVRADKLAPVPPQLIPRGRERADIIGTPAECTELNYYSEAALRRAAANILSAPNGEQEVMLNREAFSIGTLAGGGGVPAAVALDVLVTAANGIASHNPARPWRPGEAERKVRGAFAKGMAKPRPDWADVERAFDAEMEGADV